jgi:carbon starvation protein
MSLVALLLVSGALLWIGYITYGSFLRRVFDLDDKKPTPAVTLRDDVDFVPTNRWYLLGQHLSAIAAAGPIVGPILAGLWFGWLPTALWVILGSIFIGGVHDMASIAASMHHKGKSIADIVRAHMSRRAYILFLLFLWFSIVYIITAFTDITASTFTDTIHGAGVASSSMLYLALALVMGIILKTVKLPLIISTAIFLPLVLVCIWLGPIIPLSVSGFWGMDARTSWDIILLVYCFFAAVIPVWLLLQPRGYLGGFFLALTAGVSCIGILIGTITQRYTINFPAFTQWVNPVGLPLFPLLFTTVACGACSGFHSIVASGTTSKQISKETDAKVVGYGGMLLEAAVALIALATLLILTPAQAHKLGDPNQIYAQGIATFLSAIGINWEFAFNFALLAFATFVYDTLDVATRLGRYIFQELTGLKNAAGAIIATIATLILPLACVTTKTFDAYGNIIPAWKVFWTVFGSSNQLLAAMTLLGLSVWLYRKKSSFLITLLPAVFMSAIAVLSLLLILKPWAKSLFSGQVMAINPMVLTSIILLVLAMLLIAETIHILIKRHRT